MGGVFRPHQIRIQPADANRDIGLALIEERHRGGIEFGARIPSKAAFAQRHPIEQIVRQKLVPLSMPLFVEQSRFLPVKTLNPGEKRIFDGLAVAAHGDQLGGGCAGVLQRQPRIQRIVRLAIQGGVHSAGSETGIFGVASGMSDQLSASIISTQRL